MTQAVFHLVFCIDPTLNDFQKSLASSTFTSDANYWRSEFLAASKN
jgi:hypothetical protein